MANLAAALAPLLSLGQAAPAQQQQSQAVTGDSLLAGLMAPPPRTQAEQMRTSIGGMFGLDTRPATEKLAEQLASKPLTTAADYFNAAQVAKDLNLSSQAIQLNEMGSAKQKEEATKEAGRIKDTTQRTSSLLRINSIADTVKDPLTKARLESLKPQVATGSITADQANKQIADILKEARESTLSPKDRAALFKDFTPESIAAYEAGTGSLMPREKEIELTTDIKNIMLALGTSDENDLRVRAALQKLNDSKVRANEGLTDVQQRTEVANYVQNLPDYDTSTEQYGRAKSIIDTIPKAGSLAGGYTLLASMMGQLYDNDLRAASVVDKFLKQKDIAARIEDGVLIFATGTPSEDSINTIKELAETMKTYYERDLNQKINSASGLYSGSVDDAAIKVVQQSLRTAAGLPPATSLPRQSSPDEAPPPTAEMSNEELAEFYQNR